MTKFQQTHFDVTPDFGRVHRVGKPRGIVARFCNYQERERVYQEGRKLADTGTNVFISEDHLGTADSLETLC